MGALIQKGNFDRCYHPEATELVRMRQRHGHDTPIGRRCSNLDEMLQNRKTATGDQLANLNYWIGVQIDDLARLTK